jgi:hypothetical protein
MMDSWRKNYVKGYGKRECPRARRLFIRVKQTLCKLEGDRLRVSISPRRYVYFDLSKRYFKIPKEVSSRGGWGAGHHPRQDTPTNTLT